MRDHHNIVGSEVGRPRPPVYMLKTLRLAKRRRAMPVIFAGAVLAVLLLVGAVILTWA